MRPGASPCGGPSALSWSRAALRGLKPAPAWTGMGSVRPARRFDAHQALASTSLPNRLASDGGPPCASALLQRPIATPPHRPAWSEDRHVGRCFLSWAFSPYDTSGAEDPYRSSFRLDRVPRPGFQTPIAASTSVPSGARRRRSVHGLHPATSTVRSLIPPAVRVLDPSVSSIARFRPATRLLDSPGGSIARPDQQPDYSARRHGPIARPGQRSDYSAHQHSPIARPGRQPDCSAHQAVPIARTRQHHGARHHHPAEPRRTPVDSVLTSRNGAIPGRLASSVNPVASSPAQEPACANSRP
jgi:hypothetical protein